MTERRLAVIDLGSNSFRLVVFTWEDGSWWRRTDEIHEPVRIGEGLDAAGELQPEPMERALETRRALRALLPRHRRRGGQAGGDLGRSATPPTASTSSPRRTGAPASTCGCSSREEEARYGYLAAVNSTTLADGVALDLGGGSMQLVARGRPAGVRRPARGRWAPCA